MEYGFGDGVPLYAGGLGVLAADHAKVASDLRIPLVAVGLLYQEGYFRQCLTAAGHQEELYPYNDPTALPIQPGLDGVWRLAAGRDRSAREDRLVEASRAMVGRVTLYLLDSNVTLNDPFDRGLRFGRLEAQEDQASWRVSVEVYLDDLSLDDVTVPLELPLIAWQR
jgi:starch phosphorylase